MTFYGILLLYISVVVLSLGRMVMRDKRIYFDCLTSSMVIGIIVVAPIIIGAAVAKLFEIITMGIK